MEKNSVSAGKTLAMFIGDEFVLTKSIHPTETIKIGVWDTDAQVSQHADLEGVVRVKDLYLKLEQPIPEAIVIRLLTDERTTADMLEGVRSENYNWINELDAMEFQTPTDESLVRFEVLQTCLENEMVLKDLPMGSCGEACRL